MVCYSGRCLLPLAIVLLALNRPYARGSSQNGIKIKSATFLSPLFVLGPGSVENRYYYNIEFPRGHIALKSFNGEVVDEGGNPIPLHETYLHHWVVAKYYQKIEGQDENNSDYILGRNSGICQAGVLGQYFGLGSETRKTATYVPDPYGIEIGNPAEIPAGYEERWLLNVHAIDTRGVEDRLGCTECKCDLYNITVDEYGRPIRPNYDGGLLCCYDHTQCKLKHGFEGARRNLYLRYTVHWVDWVSSVVPVKIYILDVTDTGERINGSRESRGIVGCHVEYDIEPCTSGLSSDKCIDVKRASLTMPTGGYVIYGVAHQHTGGIGSTLYGEDGREICTSLPSYGQGKEAGNEAGYIVGMSTCYPQPGTVKVSQGEKLVLESNYSATIKHTGVMGLFYILVAEQEPKTWPFRHIGHRAHENLKLSAYAWPTVVLFGVVMFIAVLARSWLKKGREDAYQPILA
ncbi:hypothetical protein K2173_005438 [Erythroxylum novogranatense]|uniref:Stress up-regulated Nod 19 n=1 Tax=Erythroxylum novogranatense TaxID=1862640 RepID=A0AAV8SKN3_9ROSI|nr:hypothetical protein K2173_005438 [Erythroxylum novogranatense]